MRCGDAPLCMIVAARSYYRPLRPDGTIASTAAPVCAFFVWRERLPGRSIDRVPNGPTAGMPRRRSGHEAPGSIDSWTLGGPSRSDDGCHGILSLIHISEP